MEKNEVAVKFSGEKKDMVNFPGEKEVTMNFSKEKEVMVKPPRGKEAMMIDEDPFPPTASIDTAATNSRAMLNTKNARRFSPSARVRKVWIPKQYLTYKNDLVAKGRVPTTRAWKNNGRYPYHYFEDSKQVTENKKFSKEKNVSPREKSMNDPLRRKIHQRFIVPPIISPTQERHVGQHKKFH